MKEKKDNLFTKRKMLLMAIAAVLMLIKTARASFSCPVYIDEFGLHDFAEAVNQPDDFYIVEIEASRDYAKDETQLTSIFYCNAQKNTYLAGVKFIYGTAFDQEFGDLAKI